MSAEEAATEEVTKEEVANPLIELAGCETAKGREK
jgi:hypothetical protein